jgi:hypothetical protein
MPWVSPELNASFFDIAGQGPLAQSAVAQDQAPYGPTTIANAGQYTTGVVVAAPLSTPIVAATPLIVVVPNPATPADNLPFASFSVAITNTGGGIATITKFYILLQSF